MHLADQLKHTAELRRDYMFDHLVKAYQDPSITESRIFTKIVGENGIDVNGESREEFTLLCLHFRTCRGSTEFTPTLNPKWFLTANLPVAPGHILHHGFILHGIFPTFLSKATMVCPLTVD